MGIKAVESNVVGCRRWWGRSVEELHPRHFGGAARFAAVAGLTGTHQILPDMLTSEMAGNNMVYGEVFSLLAAVLAGIVISEKYLAAC